MTESWFVGVAGSNLELDVLRRIAAGNAGAVLFDSTPHTCLVAAAPAETCVHHRGTEYTSVLAGTALETTSGEAYRLMSTPSLAARTGTSFRSDDLLGQYAAVSLTPGNVLLSTDRSGLRSVYIRERNGVVEFATHLHLLNELGGELELDLESFGSHWFCHNLLRRGIFLKGISRVVGGETAMIPTGRYPDAPTIRHVRPETPEARETAEPIPWLRGLFRGLDREVAISLSGGLDSRLLACLCTSERPSVSTFVFGAAGEPEVDVARSVADTLGISCQVIPDVSIDESIRTGVARSYCRDNWCTTPLTAVSHLANYDRIFDNAGNRLMVDGGFGEICRAQFYRRLRLIRLASRVRPMSLNDYVGALSFFRCDVFSADALAAMRLGVQADVSSIVDSLSESSAVRPEDNLAADLKRQNFFGLGQSWVDAFGPSAMPYAQDEYIRAALAAPLHSRRYGRSYKREILEHCKDLARLNRVKSGRLIPFRMHDVLSPIALRMLKPASSGSSLRDSTILRTLLYDLVLSDSFRNSALFDQGKAECILDTFHDPPDQSEAELAWLASFLMWRDANDVT